MFLNIVGSICSLLSVENSEILARNPYFDKTAGVFKNINPEYEIKKFSDILKWGRERRRNLKTPDGDPPPLINRETILDNIRSKENSVTWLGHSSVLIRIDGKTILTDPIFFSPPFIKRFAPSPVFPNDIPEIHYVLLSHSHYDHFDIRSLRIIQTDHPGALFIVPLGMKKFTECIGIKNVIELGWWESYGIITFVPSQHWSKRFIFDTMKSLWGGYFINGASKIYYSGDTGFNESLFSMIKEKTGEMDIAILPVGAYEPRWFMKTNHINPEDTHKISIILKPKILIPVHWGTFREGDEPIDLPPKELSSVWRADPDGSELKILKIGETIKPED
ncbi:MAG TPA: MBL fold metallo-hydrolase [bacterium]